MMDQQGEESDQNREKSRNTVFRTTNTSHKLSLQYEIINPCA